MSWNWLMKGGKDDLWAHQCRVEAEWMCKNGREQQFLTGEVSTEEATWGPSSKALQGPSMAKPEETTTRWPGVKLSTSLRLFPLRKEKVIATTYCRGWWLDEMRVYMKENCSVNCKCYTSGSYCVYRHRRFNLLWQTWHQTRNLRPWGAFHSIP